MKYRGVPVLLLCCFFLAACAGVKSGEKTEPDWVNGESLRYSPSSYLIGRGADASLDMAKDRARADLAKTLEVAVSEDTRDVQTFKQQDDKGGSQRSNQLEVSRAVRTRTDALIRGVEIAATWRDPRTQQYYALATLPRAQAAQGLRQDIQELDKATERFIAQARREGDLLSKSAAANKASSAQRERAQLQRMLRVVDVSGHGITPKWDIRELESDVDALLARMRIAPRSSGSGSAALDAALRAALADGGFYSAEETSDYILEGSLDLDALGQREGWYWYVGKLEVVLRDKDGRVRGATHWLIKESSALDAVARQRAEDMAVNILKRELRSALLKFAGE